MREIVLVQHCQSEHHVNELTGGWTDTPLTDFGRRQAEAAARRLAELAGGRRFRLYSSDLLRAQRTAEIIAGELGLEVTSDPRLREIDNGVAAGMTKRWADAHRNARASEGFSLDYREFEGGESWREFHARIAGFAEPVFEGAEENVMLVSHGCAIAYLVACWLDFPQTMLERCCFRSQPGGVSVLRTNRCGQRTVVLFNDTSHLRACGR